jgi:hypothetical protein
MYTDDLILYFFIPQVPPPTHLDGTQDMPAQEVNTPAEDQLWNKGRTKRKRKQ